jgi:hypothetical protein
MNRSLMFHHFLQSECVAIRAFVDEVGEYEVFVEDQVNMKMINHITQYPELQGYYNLEVADLEVDRGDE